MMGAHSRYEVHGECALPRAYEEHLDQSERHKGSKEDDPPHKAESYRMKERGRQGRVRDVVNNKVRGLASMNVSLKGKVKVG